MEIRLCSILVLMYSAACVHAGFSVKTSVGDIVGFVDNWDDRKVRIFRGIPFAEAPVGDLRFRAPMPKAPFTEPFQANKFGHPCPQNEDLLLKFALLTREPQNVAVREDCLSLNIYVPEGGEVNKPVMVWIHGGGFTAGAGMQFEGSKLATEGDVIVVTINYRLGLFGFFSTGDDSAPGNYGLLDMQLALKWVQQNLGAFGGDVTRVTIFGESAGGGAVTLLMLAPSNEGLFHRVIAESGTALAPWAHPEQTTVAAYAKLFAEKLECWDEDSRKMVDCLRKKPDSDFSMGAMGYPHAESFGMRLVCGPRADGTFIPYDPKTNTPGERLEDLALFQSVDFIIGSNRFEGSPFLSFVSEAMYKAQTNLSLYDGVPRAVFDSHIENFGAGVLSPDTATKDAMWWLYGTSVNGNTKDLMQAKELLELMGDMMFYEGTVKFVKKHAAGEARVKNGATYLYSFLHMTSKEMGSISKFFPPEPFVDQAIHGDEVAFLFSNKTLLEYREKISPGEFELSKAMVTYWTNFAKSGNPNEPVPVSRLWPRYKLGEEEFIEFDIKEQQLDLKVNAFFRNRYMSFWNDVIPNVKVIDSKADEASETPKVKDEL